MSPSKPNHFSRAPASAWAQLLLTTILASPACGGGGVKSDIDPDGSGGEDYGCIVGEKDCDCAMGDVCDPSLSCVDNSCQDGGDTLESSGLPSDTGDTGDTDTGDTSGDGDGDASTGDGDGDASTGDGDGDASTGDGDGDASTGDGDGDASTGDGDGDASTGDGDGDATTGDGDGDGDGDGSTT